METKTLRAEVKAVGDEGPGEFEAILSTEDLDRDGEVVVAKALDPLPKRIPIDTDHGRTVATTVGSGTPYYDGNVLKIKGTFASTPLGQEMRTLVKEGHISHMSVAMAFVKKETRDGITYITKGELINAGFTPIPANTAASVLSSKSKLTDKVGARNSAKDAARIQDTHDHMVELGAVCSEKHFHAADDKTLIDDIINADVVDLTGSTDTEPPADAATAASAGALVEVVRARTRAKLLLAQANLALE